MANYNRTLLMGNLTRDPELRYIPNGSAVANLRLAVNRTYKNQSGEVKEEVTYVNIVVWGKQAENCAEYLSKGRPIFVEGRLQSRQWETDDGQKRSVLEVVADRVQFLERKKSSDAMDHESENRAAGEKSTAPSMPVGHTEGDEDIPF
ncbi:single-stranded DNA-binding protein [bacterium]|nr:single-stranded DNA-binding protein [bacterium]